MDSGTRHLFQAIGTKQLTQVKELLAAGASANQPEDDNTPLMWAAKTGEPECVKTLLAAGAAIEAVDKYGSTALLSAAHRGRVDAVRVLIAAGANVNHLGSFSIGGGSVTALAAAVRDRTKDNLEMAKALIAAGADVNLGDWPPLMWACASSSPAVVKALVSAGAPVNQIASWGSPLTVAIRENRADIVEALLDVRADPHQRMPANHPKADLAGKTPLECAQVKKAKKIIALLEAPRGQPEKVKSD